MLSQNELFWAEGGPAGLGVQVGAVAGGLAGLFMYQPHLLQYLRKAQLRPNEWAVVLAASFGSYAVGHFMGTIMFGDRQKLKNHWMAYLYQKQLNRFEGRQILTKKPTYWKEVREVNCKNALHIPIKNVLFKHIQYYL